MEDPRKVIPGFHRILWINYKVNYPITWPQQFKNSTKMNSGVWKVRTVHCWSKSKESNQDVDALDWWLILTNSQLFTVR